VLTLVGVSKTYATRSAAPVHALTDVSFTVPRDSTVGLIGESGAGKTTLTRCILGLEKPDSGSIVFDGAEVSALSKRELFDLRARIQIVFQDPFASLDPRMSAHDIVAEGMLIHRHRLRRDSTVRTARVRELFDRVGLARNHLYRFPHEFSGGQRQRLGIARAIALSPEMLVLDEPTSALDVSVQAQVLNLLVDLQHSLNLTYLFISHDLAVIRHMCSRVEMIKDGRIVESGPTEAFFERPQSEYARALLAAIPTLELDHSLFATRGRRA
jgi:ABC-type oligopeptide transport system ATPase subunit